MICTKTIDDYKIDDVKLCAHWLKETLKTFYRLQLIALMEKFRYSLTITSVLLNIIDANTNLYFTYTAIMIFTNIAVGVTGVQK